LEGIEMLMGIQSVGAMPIWTSSWVPLKDLKESHQVQMAEYALANNILEESAFAWWAWHVLCKSNRII
jgi:hypothetical protein